MEEALQPRAIASLPSIPFLLKGASLPALSKRKEVRSETDVSNAELESDIDAFLEDGLDENWLSNLEALEIALPDIVADVDSTDVGDVFDLASVRFETTQSFLIRR